MLFTEISFNKIKNEVDTYLRTVYNKSNVLFTNASPYGQILNVVNNLYSLSILYLKNTIKQFDLSESNIQNENNVKNAAINAGHIPTRSVSSTGTLKITYKTNSDVNRDIPGSRITIPNRLLLKNKTNGLEYSVNIGGDSQTYNITSNTKIFLHIIQGKWDRRTFTGTGEQNQTYQVVLRNGKDIENFNFNVLINGELFEIKKHIYDMLPNEKSCVVRTGYNGGVDIIFGNGSFGYIPPIGSIIEFDYLVSDGLSGSIFRRTLNDWLFVDQIQTENGNFVDLNRFFDVEYYTDINFGCDKESVNFTKNLLPISSNNFVIGTPSQYAYNIKRLGVFSHVNAYEDNNSIYVVATPNINIFKNRNDNYFNIDKRAFELDSYEKSKVLKYLRSGGNILLTKNIIISSPKLSYYVINIFIITYSDSVDENVDSEIYNKLSEYFLNLNKLNRVPKSDIINILSDINDINSVDISFMSKNNEDYHRNAIIYSENIKNIEADKSDLKVTKPLLDYNVNESIGIDPLLGDIIFESSELPIIRGGFYDRNSVYYNDGIQGTGLKSVNIYRKGKVNRNNN